MAIDDETEEIVKEFLVESTENLDQLDRDLVMLEEDPSNGQVLASVFRTIHTIKGTCGFLGYGKLESIAENVWGTTLGIAVSRLPEWAGPEAAASMLVGVVRIRGAWTGAVVVHCPHELAAAAASIIFSIDDGTSPSATEMQDALLELTNMIGGDMKALLPEPCELSLPVLSAATDLTAPAGTKIAELALTCESHPLLVTVYEVGDS